MARFALGNENNYSSGEGTAGFFSLRNDKDTAVVRFLYNGVEDVTGHAVHQVEVNGKKRWVSCLREPGMGKDVCPLCQAGNFVNAKFFIPLYNVDEDKVQIWERGRAFGSKLASLCSHYPELVKHTFEIERNGAKGDPTTRYDIYPLGDKSDVTVSDFDECNVDGEGGLVLSKSADEMTYYLNVGEFPDNTHNTRTQRAGTSDMPRRRPAHDSF